MALSKMSMLTKGGDPSAEQVNNKLRSDWNAYTAWLDKKGFKGHPALDKNDFGGKMIDLYRKETPTTSVSRDTIKPIQQEFSKYRDWVLQRVKEGKAQLSPGTDQNNFMKDLSIVDGIPGQRTTSFSFPDSYLTTFNNGQNMGTQNLGFSTMK